MSAVPSPLRSPGPDDRVEDVPAGAGADAGEPAAAAVAGVEPEGAGGPLAGQDVRALVAGEVPGAHDRVEDVPAGAGADAGEPAAAAVAAVDPQGAGGPLAGQDVGSAVAGEVTGRLEPVVAAPAGADADAAGERAAARPGVQPQVGGGRAPGEDVVLPVAVPVGGRAGQRRGRHGQRREGVRGAQEVVVAGVVVPLGQAHRAAGEAGRAAQVQRPRWGSRGGRPWPRRARRAATRSR